MTKIFSYSDIVKPRIPPIIWNIFSFIVSFYIVIKNNKFILYIGLCITSLYIILNLIFDIYTLSISLDKYSNIKNNNFNDLTFFENLYCPNKKYNISYINVPGNTSCPIEQTKNNYFTYEVNMYDGNNNFIRNLLKIIYFSGITTKIYIETDSIKENLKEISFC